MVSPTQEGSEGQRRKTVLECLGGAAQQVVAADLAVENLHETFFALVAFQAKFGLTTQAARRLSSGPLGETLACSHLS
jgi:hypothetical protein